MSEDRAFIVLWDFPYACKSNLSTFYRRLGELLADYGGAARCRATKSAYIVSGVGAMGLAYAIGVLASAFGGGRVGEQDGVVVLPLADISPGEHFDSLARAGEIVSGLCEDRRRLRRKQAVSQAQSVERKE
jgi:hypothetical protein